MSTDCTDSLPGAVPMNPATTFGRQDEAEDAVHQDNGSVEPNAEETESDNKSVTSLAGLCVVCFERPIGEPLVPCGHKHFCDYCTERFRRCPLCRAPLAVLSSGVSESDVRTTNTEPELLSQTQIGSFCFLIAAVWGFIWIGSYSEWSHDVPRGTSPTKCKRFQKAEKGCTECNEGYINGGLKCYDDLEDIPSVEMGAFLGGTFYFAIIVIVQLCGAATEVFLIRRVHSLGLLPRKELVILGVALAIELVRMMVVDIFVLQDYFGGGAYHIYRVPRLCESGGWLAADNQWYCNDTFLANETDALFYIAQSRESYSGDPAKCSAFSAQSPLLDYGPKSETWIFQFWGGGGHARFSRLGWVIGGEFAFYYFFATFVNEIADNVFVIPTTIDRGWFFKVFSIALELFQLGALCPAAIFSHRACLHYTDPLGVDLRVIRDLITSFGYTIAVLPFFAIPLAVVGLGMIGVFLCLSGTVFQVVAVPAARLAGNDAAERLDRQRAALKEKINSALALYRRSLGQLVVIVMGLSFIPLLFGGMFLGCLVIVGQASKSGSMQVVTAIILTSDVAFKIFATAVMEIADYALHLRVSRAVASAQAASSGDTVLRTIEVNPAASSSSTDTE